MVTHLSLLAATVSDPDSYIDRVEFFLNNVLCAVKTNSPFALTLTNFPSGTYPVVAVVYDDEGAARTSMVATVTAPLAVDGIQSLSGNRNVIRFDAPLNQPFRLQLTQTLSPPNWTDFASYPASSLPRTISATNVLAPGATSCFYRLAVP